MLSRLVIAFLPRSKCLLISCLQSLLAVIWGLKKINSVTVYIVSPSICHEVMVPDAMIFIFWKLSFKPAFFTLLFHFHQDALQFLLAFCNQAETQKQDGICISEVLILLPAILIPACVSSNLAFCMMYCAYRLIKLGDNIHPWTTPFPIWNQSIVPCPVITVVYWPAYRFLRRQFNGLVFPSL